MHKHIGKHQVLLETVGSTGQINCGVHKLAPEDGESFSQWNINIWQHSEELIFEKPTENYRWIDFQMK